MSIRVVRVLEYTFPDDRTYKMHAAGWRRIVDVETMKMTSFVLKEHTIDGVQFNQTNREEILMTERVRQLKTTEIMQIIATDPDLFVAYCEGGEFRDFIDDVNDATNGEEAVKALASRVLHEMRKTGFISATNQKLGE